MVVSTRGGSARRRVARRRSSPTRPTGATKTESQAAGQPLKTETYVPRHVRHMSRDITTKPEMGLEPMTYRLQGDCSTS